MSAPYLLLLATLFPLASFLVLIFFGRWMGVFSSYVASAAIIASFAVSVWALVVFTGKDTGPHRGPSAVQVEAVAIDWIPVAHATSPNLQVGLMVDSLTLTMFLMVTAVAALVHIFSIGYMKGDARFSRFFAYLGLFCFSMLGLVVSNSLLQLFIFWELVGICSYLLIGFWFEKRGPALASKKAMVTNRIGDAGFLVGLGILVWHLGPGALTLFDAHGGAVLAERVKQVTELNATEYLQLTAAAGPWGWHWLTWAGVCLFLGAMAKSAQFPLHVWLPDAMEGPTPVSALIHAATMVAAGVYLVARIFPILTLDARLVVALIGCTTLLMAALMAVVMTDIKKVLAYSTISQLGFMMLFLGCGGWVAGLFHLITHAFFKSCLFLGSGSVIIGCHHEQEITRMGGLWKKMPITALTFGVSVLAIAGTPFFSGYYSKDLGLSGVFDYAHSLPHPYGMLLFWIPTAAAYLTAFYMMRVWWLTFGGKPRDHEVYDHAKEHPVMTLPLIILGIMAVIAGYKYLNIEELIRNAKPAGYLVLGNPSEDAEGMVAKWVGWAWLISMAAAVAIYFRGFALADRIRRLPVVNLIYIWLKNKMYFDALYEGFVVNLCKLVSWLIGTFDKFGVDGVVNASAALTRIISWISGRVDNLLVDGAVNGMAVAAQEAGRGFRTPETGRIRFYVLSLVTVVAIGIAGITVGMLVLNH